MYHKNCLSSYLRKCEREIEMIMNPPLDRAENVEITNIFQAFVTEGEVQGSTASTKNNVPSL